jgi:hypothetical protein
MDVNHKTASTAASLNRRFRYLVSQLLTIKDLIEGNKNVQRPLHVREVTFKKAPRARPDAAQNLSLNLTQDEGLK